MFVYKISQSINSPITWTKEIWNLIYKSMKSQGFNFYSQDDTKENFKKISKRLNNDNFFLDIQTFPEWNIAIQNAFQSVQKRKTTIKEKQKEKDKFLNVNWNRLKDLGYTTNPMEAGYISPDGKFVDLSGKKEGGQPNQRSFDHREVGGTKGMQEAMAYGYIRCDANSGSLDIAKEPTTEQYQAINTFLSKSPSSNFYIDMQNGLGEYNKSNEFYATPDSNFTYIYPSTISIREIITDIYNYYKNPTHPKYKSKLSDKTS